MSYFFSNPQFRQNLEIQAELVLKQVWRTQLYTNLVDFANIKPTEKGVEYVMPLGQKLEMENARIVDKPVVVYQEFKRKEGGTNMQIPVKRTSFPKPILGDDTIQGKETTPEWVYQTLRVNAVSHAVKTRAGYFQEQTYKSILSDIINARPELTDIVGRYINTALIKYALFYGASFELVRPSIEFGRGVSTMAHPNIYTPVSGWVSYNPVTDTYTNLPGTAAYELDVESAVNSINPSNVNHQFNTALVDKMSTLIPDKRIMPCINIGGQGYYLWIITSAQKHQLFGDSKFKEIAQTIIPREKDPFNNFLINNQAFAYRGFIFLTDIEGWGAHTNANPQGWSSVPAGKVMWGAEYKSGEKDFTIIKNRDHSVYQCSVILGKRAINVGLAMPPKFVTETWDYGKNEGVALINMFGAERASQFDSDNRYGLGAGSFVEDTGSAIVITGTNPVT
jgi:hypothetical protein